MKALFKTNCPSIIVDAARCTLHINYNMPFHCRLDLLCRVLSNCLSGSSVDMTCYIAKQIRNAKVIGMRTWGATGGLSLKEKNEYWGSVKSEDLCFSLCIPCTSFISKDGEILEGVGVTPDMEVELDVDEYERTGRDTQLERALEFIRIGK